jgi:FkbH-like protein
MSLAPSAALVAQRRWLSHRRNPEGGAALRIGVTASFTAEPLEVFLGAHLLDAGFAPTFSFAEYNQIHQVCFDPVGALGPVDVLVVLWRLEDLFAEAVRTVAAGATSAAAEVVSGAADLGRTVGDMASAAGYPVLVTVPPLPAPVGVDLADSVVGIGLRRLHTAALAAFSASLGTAPVRLVDLDGWVSAFGGERARDVVKTLAYRQPYSTEFWDVLGAQMAALVAREWRPPPKCLVLDCDNTLWGGVIGEEGIGGIALGSAFPGSAYQEFQKVLKDLKRRGVLLAISSKNNPREVLDVFAEHDDMVLSSDDISVWKLNWEPKSGNLREIAAELNIGLDSLVFVDDSEYELAEVASSMPEVARLLVPEEVALLPDLLPTSGLFRNMQVTAEDLVRADMIREEQGRREAEAGMSRESFLESLDLVVDYLAIREEHVGRVAQLTNKTNQFNLTTIRRGEADIRALLTSDDHLVRAIRVSDKFGDYGLVGVGILHAGERDWEIDTFLMSCRVLGRGIESAFLRKLADDARAAGAGALVGRYVPTSKNAQVADLYPRHGFATVAEGTYRAEFSDLPPVPDYIVVR